ncbi:MAG: hypothetical protein HYS27_22495 [Deltaproteobacteria bacterium]|nr:hypothetical protein [Deltaproteobacteria bacterium]
MTRLYAPLALACLLALTLGCRSRITGNEGNFQFSYPADDDVVDFNKPIAIGAMLDIEVTDVGQNRPVTLSVAESDDVAVLEVASFEGSSVTVRGVADGNPLLSVTGTTAAGEELSDSVNLLVREPEVLRLAHTCSTTGTGAYITSQRVYVPFEMERANGQAVIGYGRYPATPSDAAALTLDAAASNQQFMAFDTGAAAATLTLDSDIDDTTLDVQLVDQGAIDGVEQPIAFVLEDIDVGDVNAFYVRPTTGGTTICQADIEKTVQSDTPAICDVRERNEAEDGGDAVHEFGWFEIEGIAAGTCNYTVTFPGGAAGAGTSAQFSYEIQP